MNLNDFILCLEDIKIKHGGLMEVIAEAEGMLSEKMFFIERVQFDEDSGAILLKPEKLALNGV